MKHRVLALMLGAFGVFLTGCEDTTTNTPVTFIPAPPSNLMALSIDETTVRLKWTPSPSESNADFKGYRITVTSGTQTFNPITLGKGETIVDIKSLDANKTYTFTVAAYTNDTVSSGISILNGQVRSVSVASAHSKLHRPTVAAFACSMAPT